MRRIGYHAPYIRALARKPLVTVSLIPRDLASPVLSLIFDIYIYYNTHYKRGTPIHLMYYIIFLYTNGLTQ